MQWLSTFTLLILCSSLSAVEWLKPGVHEVATARPGIACTLVVPTAISDGKPLPVLFVVAQDGKPDAKRWQDWGERRSCVVVGIQGYGYVTTTTGVGNGAGTGVGVGAGVGGSSNSAGDAVEVYAGVMTALKKSVPIHPFLRFVTGAQTALSLVVAIPGQVREPFGGMLLINAQGVGELRPEVPLVMVVHDSEASVGNARKVSDRFIAAGGTVRIATYDGMYGEPAFDIHVRAMDWLMNISKASHSEFSARERKANLEEIAKQAQELAGLVNPGARRECAGFLMTVPGMDKMRREYERLADTWIESSVELVKELEAKNPVDAHEFLCVLVKGQRYKDASVKQQKVAQAELTRIRKNPLIKQEIAAADLVADTCAMLEHDDSLAKQRIALKDLQAVIAQYPKTQAAIAAIKLVSRLQQSLR